MTTAAVRGQLDLRALTTADAPDLLRLAELPGLDVSILAAELAPDSAYRWIGMTGPAGELLAAHRSMFWGDYLLLKGLFADASARGTGAALRLAFELREVARREGRRGIVAWVPPKSPATLVAQRLRLRPAGPWVHRYEFPVPLQEASQAPAAAGTFGAVTATTGSVMVRAEGTAASWIVPNLLHAPEAEARGGTSGSHDRSVHWVVDRTRLSLSGLPCSRLEHLPRLLEELAPLARQLRRVSSVEIPVPAADISCVLWMLAHNARRVTSTPARLGRRDFACKEIEIAGVPAAQPRNGIAHAPRASYDSAHIGVRGTPAEDGAGQP
jgi:hypothetical protein